jgi:hypothetical protein
MKQSERIPVRAFGTCSGVPTPKFATLAARTEMNFVVVGALANKPASRANMRHVRQKDRFSDKDTHKNQRPRITGTLPGCVKAPGRTPAKGGARTQVPYGKC